MVDGQRLTGRAFLDAHDMAVRVEALRVAPVCLYGGADFTGLLDNNPAWTPSPGGKDDMISSVINDFDRRVRVWADIN